MRYTNLRCQSEAAYWQIIKIKLTREDTATNGDISSERAFLVDVGALNSLREEKTHTIKNGQANASNFCISDRHQ